MLIRNIGRFIALFSRNKQLEEIIERFKPQSFDGMSEEEYAKFKKDWDYCKDLDLDVDLDLHKY